MSNEEYIQKVASLEKELATTKQELATVTADFASFKETSAKEVKKLLANTGGEIIREAMAFKHKGKTFKFLFPKFNISGKPYDAAVIVKDPKEHAEMIDAAIAFGGFIEEIK